MSLLDVFLELNIPQTENSKLFIAKALNNFPFAKIGVNFLGFPVILISSKFDQTHLLQKNIKLKYIELTHNLECKVSENGQSKIDNYSVIIFKSNEETLQNYFLGIATSLLYLIHPYCCLITLYDWYLILSFQFVILNRTLHQLILVNNKYHIVCNRLNFLGYETEN